MARCKSYFYKTESSDGICPVCGIAQNKMEKELTEKEKRVKYFARGIRAVSNLHIISGMLLIFFVPLALLRRHGIPSDSLATEVHMSLAIGFALLILSYGLRRYQAWAYYMALLLYTIIFIITIVWGLNLYPSVPQMLGSLICILLIILIAYYIGNGVSRSIFKKKLKINR